MPRDQPLAAKLREIVKEAILSEGQVLLGWREVPVDNSSLSQAPDIAASEPNQLQLFIGRGKDIEDEDAFERRLFILRKVISNSTIAEFGRRGRFLHGLALLPHHCLQGHVSGLSVGCLL